MTLITDNKIIPIPEPNPVQVARIIDKTFNRYMNSSSFVSEMKRRWKDELRSVLLVITCPKKNVNFGARIIYGEIRKFTPDEYNNVPPETAWAHCDSKTFIKLLVGKDEYNYPYSVGYAWTSGKLTFDGDYAMVNRVILEDLFNEFQSISRIDIKEIDNC